MEKIVIFGNGEIAELAHYYLSNDKNSKYTVVAFVVDDEYVSGANFKGLPLVPLSKLVSLYPPSKYKAHVSLSYNKLNQIREEKFNLMKSLGYKLVSYICSKSFFWPDINVGENCFIGTGSVIINNIKIYNVIYYQNLGKNGRVNVYSKSTF